MCHVSILFFKNVYVYRKMSMLVLKNAPPFYVINNMVFVKNKNFCRHFVHAHDGGQTIIFVSYFVYLTLI